jgi:hypothetical protein
MSMGRSGHKRLVQPISYLVEEFGGNNLTTDDTDYTDFQ